MAGGELQGRRGVARSVGSAVSSMYHGLDGHDHEPAGRQEHVKLLPQDTHCLRSYSLVGQSGTA